MKKIILPLVCCILFLIACGGNDPKLEEVSNSITITVDGSDVYDFSTNVLATDVPINSVTGYNCKFLIISEDSLNNKFMLDFLNQADCPYVTITPSSRVLEGVLMSNLQIDGLNIDYSNEDNLITINYNSFGSVGDEIDITFSGTFYDTNSFSHTINGHINVLRS
jgi:hypothetical protein